MSESMQKKKERVRAPRVQINYDVDLGDSIVRKEIPMVVGVLADLSGKPEEPLTRLRERKFQKVDRDNFDGYLKSQKPRLAYTVDNKLADDGSRMAVELKFEGIKDFEPQNVARQVPALQALVNARNKLETLKNMLDGNDRGAELIESVLRDMDLKGNKQS